MVFSPSKRFTAIEGNGQVRTRHKTRQTKNLRKNGDEVVTECHFTFGNGCKNSRNFVDERVREHRSHASSLHKPSVKRQKEVWDWVNAVSLYLSRVGAVAFLRCDAVDCKVMNEEGEFRGNHFLQCCRFFHSKLWGNQEQLTINSSQRHRVKRSLWRCVALDRISGENERQCKMMRREG